MGRLFLLIFALLLASPAAAHGLRVFARVEGAQVRGYGFFIGGGRPAGVDWRAEVAGQGVAQGVAQGKTDTEGGFAFAAPSVGAGDLVITLNTGDGHMASTRLPPERFGAAAAAVPSVPAPASAPASPSTAAPAPDTAALEVALARQLAPLEERLTALEARLRFTDALSSVFFIFGLAGMALWALGRRGGGGGAK